VSWDGADDPTNPKNWSFKRRWGITVLVSLITFMTGISSAIIAPASDIIGDEFNTHSSFRKQLNFSIIQLAYVIGPLALAPLSEVYGRSYILQLSNVFFLIFNFVNGFANSDGQFLAFRFLSGLGACAPLTIGGGVLSDLWRPEEIGMAIGLYTLAPLLSPALGPLLGAWIVERTTWKWCFFSITIFGVIVQTLVFFTLKETYGPRILQLKAQKLRKETGNSHLRTSFELKDLSLASIMRNSLARVVLLLTTQPIIIFLSVYFAVVYGIIYLMLVSTHRLFHLQYLT
jgi:MFS family permease